MKISKNKKILLMFPLALTLLFNTVFITNVKAETKDFSGCTIDKALKYYNVTTSDKTVKEGGQDIIKSTLNASKGTLVIKEIVEGFYDEVSDPGTYSGKDGKYDDSGWYQVDTSSLHVLNASSLIGKTIVGGDSTTKNPTLKLSFIGSNDQERMVRITLAVAQADSLCDSEKGYKEAAEKKTKSKTAQLYIYIPVPQKGVQNTILSNENYYKNGCRFIRGEISADQYVTEYVASDIKNKYVENRTSEAYRNTVNKIVPYCVNQGAAVTVNYTDKELDPIISSVIKTASYANVASSSEISPQAEKSGLSFDLSKYPNIKKYENTTPAKIKEKTFAMSCQYTSKSANMKEYNSRNEDGTYNYANKKYYYASTTFSETVKYEFNYEGQGTKYSDPVKVCDKTCEEIVEVSYGPPQAAVAGFCFEYQIKVISRVKCNTELHLENAPTLQGYCTPSPRCEHRNGQVLTQSGPSEEFDACVKQCDGGKYSQKCSNKCYKKVYGNSSGVFGTNSINTGAVTNMSIPQGASSEGYYTREGGEIVWKSTGSQQSYARWYEYNDHKAYSNGSGYFYADPGGFKRKYYTSAVKGWAKAGDTCDGECHHVGCGDDTYLNPQTPQNDYNKNLQKFEQAVNKCQAGSTCTTSTSTYNISVNYQTGTTSKTFDTATLVSGESKDATTDKDKIILSKDGCYAKSANDFYKSEWSFPGTWVNNKTGEISFVPKDSGGWHQTKNKFCLPLDTPAKNSAWWNWYMNQLQGNPAAEENSYKNNGYMDTCTTKRINNINEYKPDYNIKGSAREFGYFHWNFDISCFYATPETNTPPECPPTLNNYTTRSVDNQDLFPSTETNATSTTNPATTGRTPGYNWTSAATITKNEDYAINPSVLITKIQKLKSGVYNESNDGEDYLDYQISLTPEQITRIKKDLKSGNLKYSEWDGKTTYNEKTDYVIKYRSNFLDTYTTVNKRVEKLCNNNKSKDECLSLLSN